MPGTDRCRFHGGRQQAADVHDNARGGRPPLHGFYATRLPPDAHAEIAHELELLNVDEVPPRGSLEYELLLARWMLRQALRRFVVDPTGGLKEFDGYQLRKYRLHDTTVGEWVDRVAKLERHQAVLEGLADGDDDDDELDSHAAYLERLEGLEESTARGRAALGDGRPAVSPSPAVRES